jgi:hypothetical protein
MLDKVMPQMRAVRFDNVTDIVGIEIYGHGACSRFAAIMPLDEISASSSQEMMRDHMPKCGISISPDRRGQRENWSRLQLVNLLKITADETKENPCRPSAVPRPARYSF